MLITLVLQQIVKLLLKKISKQEKVVNDIENATHNEVNADEAKQAKTRTKAKPKSKPKTQNDTATELTKAETKDVADINNQFHTLLNRIGKIPNFKDNLIKCCLFIFRTLGGRHVGCARLCGWSARIDPISPRTEEANNVEQRMPSRLYLSQAKHALKTVHHSFD